MKEMLSKFLKHTSLILVMLAIVFGTFQPLMVMAQVADSGAVDNQLTAQSQAVTAQTQATLSSGGTITPTTAAPSSVSGNTGVDNTSDIGCNLGTIAGNLGGGFALCLTNVVYIFTVGMGSGFAYVSAYFFDYAISLSLNSAAYGLDFVSQGWTTARDIANMAFLFILIYIAFLIMFEAETSGTIPLLTAVIIVALLVNFSFFLTRLAVDAGNILSIQFYNAITAPSIAQTASGAGVTNGSLPNQSTAASVVSNTAGYLTGTTGFSSSKDLTASIMGMLQLQNLFNTTSFQAFFNGGTPGTTGSTPTGAGFMVTAIALSFLYVAAAIMFWLLTVMFATAGAKFLFRIVALWFLIIASPLAFVARAVPGMEKYFHQWLSMLIENAFYPAAFMFIFLILTDFATEMSSSCTTAGSCTGLINGIFDGLSAATNSSSAVAQIGYAAANVGIRMGFVIAILWVGLEASKRLGVMGGEAANHFGNWVGTGFLKAQNVPYKRLGPGAWAGGVDRALQTGKGSVRIPFLGERAFNSPLLARFGNSAVGYEARRYGTRPLAGTTVPGSHGESFTELKERQKKEGAEVGANMRDVDVQENVARTTAIIGKNKRDNKAPHEGIPEKDVEQIQNLGKREMEAMGSVNIEKIAGLLKESQIKTVKDSDKFSDATKEKADAEWNAHSDDSPLMKANKQIKLLREINDNLKEGKIDIKELDDRIGRGNTKGTGRVDSVIDTVAIKAMSKDVDAKISVVKSDIKEAKGPTVELQHNLHLLEKAAKRLDDLDKARENIPPDIGGNKNKGAFDTSKIV
jgi:hypothetical protein